MPLPQQVINQLAREPAKTPGWSSGVLLFSGTVFVISVVIYFILNLGYRPYLNAQNQSLQDQVAKLSQSIPTDDQAKLVTFYSQISNLRSLLQNHIFFSQFLDWLAKNTETNVSYAQLTFGSGNQVTLTGNAKTEADINQQVAIFETSPQVKRAVISNAALAPGGTVWTFAVTLTMDPSIFSAPSTTPAPAVTPTPTPVPAANSTSTK